jgi:hypothetical protein
LERSEGREVRSEVREVGAQHRRAAPPTKSSNGSKGGSGTRPYLDQHHSAFAIRNSPFALSRGCLPTRPPIRRIGRIAHQRRCTPANHPTHSAPQFAIRHSLFAHHRGRLAAGKMPVPQHNKGGSGTRPYGFAPFSIRYPCGAAGRAQRRCVPYDSSRLQRPGLESSPTASPCRGRAG